MLSVKEVSCQSCVREDALLFDKQDRISDLLLLSIIFITTGKDSFEHTGNQRFRKCIDQHLSIYMGATTRQEKSSIVTKIYDEVRAKASKPGGGFVKKVSRALSAAILLQLYVLAVHESFLSLFPQLFKDLLTRMWFQVSEKEARDKVGQALRDAIKIVRGPKRRKAAASITTVATDGPRTAKKLRTASLDRPQHLKQAHQLDSLKMALGGAAAAAAANNNTRSLLENQINSGALGPFPISSAAGLRGWGGEDNTHDARSAEAAGATKSMLESVIEPLESFAAGQQSIDLSKLNDMKRRLSISNDPFSPEGQLQQQMEQLAAQKRTFQMLGGTSSDFGAAGGMPSMGTLRRLSLLGDQFFGTNGGAGADVGTQQVTSANLPATAGLFGLSSFAGSGGIDASILSSLRPQQDTTQPPTTQSTGGAGGFFDLEPTPLSGTGGESQQQHATAKHSG